MAFLTPDKIRTEHGLVIKEKIIPWGAKWTKNWGGFKAGDLFKADKILSNGTGKPKKITIHNTDDIKEAVGTNDAEQYARATWPNQNMGDARVHYYIDETDCWQMLREDEVGWHAGDGANGPGNNTSIAIEIIMKGDGNKDDIEAENRGALLTAILLNCHGLTINDVVPHRTWNGKNCPRYILPHWNDFIAKVNSYLENIKGINKPTNSNINVGDLVKIQKDAPIYGQTKTFKSWVYNSKLYVREINGSRVVISTLKTGAVTGAVDKKYLIKI